MLTEETRCRFLLLAFLVGLMLTGGLEERATAQVGLVRALRKIPRIRKAPKIPKYVQPHYRAAPRRLTEEPFFGPRLLNLPRGTEWLKRANDGASVLSSLSSYMPDDSFESLSLPEFLQFPPTRHTSALTLQGYAGGVFSVIFSLDGKRIASGSMDGTAKVWDAETGQELLTLKGHSFADSGVSFIPDGKRIVSRGQSSTVRLWDAVTGEEMTMLKGYSFTFQEPLTLAPPVYNASFNPNGKRIVSSNRDGTVKIRDFLLGRETLTLYRDPGRVANARFSPDDNWIVSGNWDGTVKVRNIKTGKETFTLKGHSGPVLSAEFFQDGRWIVTGSMDGTVEVWFCRNPFPSPPAR